MIMLLHYTDWLMTVNWQMTDDINRCDIFPGFLRFSSHARWSLRRKISATLVWLTMLRQHGGYYSSIKISRKVWYNYCFALYTCILYYYVHNIQIAGDKIALLILLPATVPSIATWWWWLVSLTIPSSSVVTVSRNTADCQSVNTRVYQLQGLLSQGPTFTRFCG